ncbi:MAG: class II aldolase/adducin family protein, partial [Deltaproteobacteria bacterium]|nr:class II aldolase/adducin family protein [Deltaproteobacteria bacterium]
IPPGCPNTEKTLSSFLSYADVFLLQNHGVLAVGKDLAQAYYRLELVEHLAKIEWVAKSLGAPQALPQKIVEKLLEKRKKAGLSRPSKSENDIPSSLDQIVAEEVNRFLSQNR